MVTNDGWVGEQLSRPIAAKGGGRRPAFTVAPHPAKLASRVDGLAAGIIGHASVFDQQLTAWRAEDRIFARFEQRRTKNSARRICAAACDDGVSCRMFLCGCCRSQVFVCRCCDRGQVYCIETCAQKARHDRQREARRRYQATPRGRAMHAERNRRYRARMRCVTDHGPGQGARRAAVAQFGRRCGIESASAQQKIARTFVL